MSNQTKKILLLGHFHVGKTSLIKRFVQNSFSEEYITSIGVTIEKKTIEIKGQNLTFIIWDVAGEVSIDRTPPNYLLGCEGIIYVFDLSRPSTWQNMQEQYDKIQSKFPFEPIKIVGNKSDLLRKKEIEEVVSKLTLNVDFLCSAKTGQNVEELFQDLGLSML